MAMVVYQGPPSSLSSHTTADTTADTNEGRSQDGFVGLSNQGATCYLNGLLQTLFMTPEFRSAIFSWNYDESKHGIQQECIPFQLQKLFGLLQLSKQRAVDTVGLTKSFGWVNNEVFQQQDVQELTRVLFDALEESFKGTSVENCIDELYAGELIDYLRCIDVDYESQRFDKFLDFSLAIVPFGSTIPMKTLNECIELYLRPEILNGDNKYYAEKFDKKVDAIKGLKFGKLPQILSVQFKRFVYDFSTDIIVQKKLNDQVKFPMILDMNRFVASKVGTEDGTSDSKVHVDDDFEQFLKEQIDKLLAEQNNDASSSSVSGAAAISTVGDDFDSMPALIDVNDIELGEVSEKAVEDNLVSQENEKIYDSLSAEEVEHLIETRGEWIYELYAVLIHSGAISGGHYYAYIKDLTTKQWWNFNDSSVSAVNEETIKLGWGGPVASSIPYYGGLYGTNTGSKALSTSNAYMLMFRKVDMNKKDVSFPRDDNVPLYIREAVEAEEQKKLEKAREEEELRNRLYIKVTVDNVERMVTAKRTDYYSDFLKNVWDQLNVKAILAAVDSQKSNSKEKSTDPDTDDDKMVDVEIDSNHKTDDSEDRILFHRFRLRNYNLYTKVRSDVYELSKAGHRRLSDLNFTDYKSYFLEVRGEDEEWEVYYDDGISLMLEEYDPITKTFKEGRNVRLPKEATVLDLKQRITKWCSYGFDEIRVLRISNYGINDARMESLDNNAKRLREDLYVSDGSKLYFEPKNPDGTPESQAFDVYLDNRNNFEIKINKFPSMEIENLLSIDGRWTVQELRRHIAKELSLEESKTRLFKLNLKGQELKDSDLSLGTVGIYNGMHLAVSVGTPTPYGYFNITFVEFRTTEYRSKITILEPSEEKLAELKLSDPSDPIVDEPIDTHSSSSTSTHVAKHTPIEVDGNPFADEGEFCEDGLDDISNEGVADIDERASIQDEFPLDVDYAGSIDDGRNYFEQSTEVDESFQQTVVNNSESSYYIDTQLIDNHDDIKANAVRATAYTADDFEIPAASATAVAAVDTSWKNLIGIDDFDMNDSITIEEQEQILLSIQQHAKTNSNTPSIEEVAVASVTAVAESVDTNEHDQAEEVEANDFGQKMVKNGYNATNFDQENSIDGIFVKNGTVISEVRQQLTDLLIAKGRLPENTPPSRVRIRDKIGNNPAKILKDNRTFVESQVYLFDGKVFAFQILDDEEELPEDEPGSVVILAQRWYRSTWSLGPRIEVYLRGSLEVQAVASGIAKLFDINFKSMLTLVVPKDTEFLQSELQSKSPARNYGRTWFDPTMETKPLKFMSHDMRMQEGDLLLVQDYSEPLKELSVADLKSIELVEIASKSNNIDFYSTQGVMLGYGPKNYGESTSLKLPALVSSNNTTTGNGIKIKTHKERIKEQSINIPKDSSTSPLDNDSKSVSPAPDVSPNDGNYITLNELSSMDLSSRVDNDNELIDNDEKEFCKQGGLALFDDIC